MPARADIGSAARDRVTLRRTLPVLLLVAVPLLCYVTGLYRLFSFDLLAQYHGTLQSWIEVHYVLAVLTYVVLYTVVTALSLPVGLLITVSGGLLFGWLVGGLGAIVGATVGATLVFMIARSSLGSGLVKQAGPWLEKLSSGFCKDAFNYLLFLRLVPAFPFWIVNLVPAILGMPLRPYVIGTLIGIIPGTFAFAYFGEGLESVISAATASYQACLAGKSAAQAALCHIEVEPSRLVTHEILIALGALGAISLLPVLIKRFAGGRAAT